MKTKRFAFTSGLLTGALIVTLGTTALAASGRVEFSLSNVALNGERRITAGETITAPNGQKVPGTILYIDEAGGKTNYLPIRAVSELLGTEIGYDSATKTVLLGEQPDAVQHWKKVVDGSRLTYVGDGDSSTPYEKIPAVTASCQAEGFGLEEIRGTRQGDQLSYRYQLGEGRISVNCARPTGSTGVGFRDASALRNGKQVTVQGHPAELYQDQEQVVLVWQPAPDLLYLISGLHVTAEQVLQVAESLKPDTAQAAEYDLSWTPRDSGLLEESAVGSTRFYTYGSAKGSFTLLSSSLPLAVPLREAESLEINGVKARYWAAEEPQEPSKISSETVGGITVTHGTVPSSHSSSASVLCWRDPNTGRNLRLVGDLSRSDLLRMAEGIR